MQDIPATLAALVVVAIAFYYAQKLGLVAVVPFSLSFVSFNLVVFGVVVPVVAFTLAALALHTAYPVVAAQSTKAEHLNMGGRIVVELCMARSAAFMTAGALVLVPAVPQGLAVLAGTAKNTDFAIELVTCWFVVVMMHEVLTYVLLGQQPPYARSGVFAAMCLLCVMSYSNALGFLAITAACDIACAADYSTYSLRCLDEPSVLHRFDRMHAVVELAANAAVLALLTRSAWTHNVDLATGVFCTYLYVRFMMPEDDLYFHAPPKPGQVHILMLDSSRFNAIADGPAVKPADDTSGDDESSGESSNSGDEQVMEVEAATTLHAMFIQRADKVTAADTMVDAWMQEVRDKKSE